MPRVSVIIPTYQRPMFLREAIGSVLNQTFQDFELIIVDDASNDNTRELVRSFTDKRIYYLCHENNKGGSAARNTGIRNAEGEYIAFLDDDDEWLPEKLGLQVDLLDNRPPEVGCVYTGYQRVDRVSGEVLPPVTPTKDGDLSRALLARNWVGLTSSVLLRKQCFERVGLFDANLPSQQDYDMWIRISKEYQFIHISKPLLIHNFHNDRLSNNPEKLGQGIEIMLRKLGSESSMLRKNYCCRFQRLGVLYLTNGQTSKGRQACYKAINLYPFRMQVYLILFLSFLGTEVFKKVIEIKRKIISPLRLPTT